MINIVLFFFIVFFIIVWIFLLRIVLWMVWWLVSFLRYVVIVWFVFRVKSLCLINVIRLLVNFMFGMFGSVFLNCVLLIIYLLKVFIVIFSGLLVVEAEGGMMWLMVELIKLMCFFIYVLVFFGRVFIIWFFSCVVLCIMFL